MILLLTVHLRSVIKLPKIETSPLVGCSQSHRCPFGKAFSQRHEDEDDNGEHIWGHQHKLAKIRKLPFIISR
jgi:hypothetical protein